MMSANVARGMRIDDAPYITATFLDIAYPQKHSNESAEDIKNRIKAKLRGYEE